MKVTNRETLQRAVGIIEGASWSASTKVQEALCTAVEMIDAILNDKEEGATDERN
jgi:hypothetical protein